MIEGDEMENPFFIELEQEPHGWDKLERILASFLGGALAALALYLFFVNTEELWSLLVALDYDQDKVDLIAIAGSAVVALLLTIFLESKKARPANSEKLHYWFQAIIRYFLAYVFLIYGFAKVFHNQFYSFSSTLDMPLGEITGLTLTWRFFGYSYAYTLFVASSQIIGSILLFYRRTTTLGAVLLLPVISNIVFVNFTHNIPVRLYSAIYLMMVLYLLFGDIKRLKALFWDNRTFGGRAFPIFSKRRLRLLVKYFVIIIFFTIAVSENYYYYVTAQRITTPLYGVWEVEDYQVNGVSRAADADPSVWKKVYFESDMFVSIKTGEPKPEVYISKLASQNQTIKLMNRNQYNTSEEGSFDFEGSYQLVSDHNLIIKVSNGADTIRVTLKRLR